MSKASVSILMPVYNCRPYLDEAIWSIRRQTFTDFEFIIVNDGSTDDSLEIALRHARDDPRIRLINQENRGVARALNTGLHDCRAEYIARMDGDDIAERHRLAVQLDWISRRSDVAVIGSQGWDIDINGHLKGRRNVRVTSGGICLSLVTGCPILHPSVMMRRSSIAMLGGYPLVASEDSALWVAVLQAGQRIESLRNRLIRYRQHAGGVGGSSACRAASKAIGYHQLCWLLGTTLRPQAYARFHTVAGGGKPVQDDSNDFLAIAASLSSILRNRFSGPDRLEAMHVLIDLSLIGLKALLAAGLDADARLVAQFVSKSLISSPAQAAYSAQYVGRLVKCCFQML